MLLHIGSDVSVRLADVILILDREAVETSAATREFLQWAKTEDRLRSVTQDQEPPKSVIVTRNLVYMSPISSLTLGRRAAHFPE